MIHLFSLSRVSFCNFASGNDNLLVKSCCFGLIVSLVELDRCGIGLVVVDGRRVCDEVVIVEGSVEERRGGDRVRGLMNEGIPISPSNESIPSKLEFRSDESLIKRSECEFCSFLPPFTSDSDKLALYIRD